MPELARQGNMDGLCGVYSIVNAVTVLWPDQMDNLDFQDGLFADLMQAVTLKFPSATVDGTTPENLRVLFEVAQGFVARNLPGRLKATTIRCAAYGEAAQWLRDVDSMIQSSGRSVAVLGFKSPAHWTVLTGAIDDVAYFADSSDMQPSYPFTAIGLRHDDDCDYILGTKHAYLLTRTE